MISATALDELLFALSEAVVNAELYGRPPTTVRVWTGQDRIVVHVHDTGPGPADPLTGLIPAPDSATGVGLGLWLSHQLADVDIAVVTTDGCTVRLRVGPLPAREHTAPRTFTVGAGTPSGAPPDRGSIHAIDGDGSSFCGRVAAAELDPLDHLPWSGVPPDRRCPQCALLLGPHGLG
jgi:hypothetical protein